MYGANINRMLPWTPSHRNRDASTAARPGRPLGVRNTPRYASAANPTLISTSTRADGPHKTTAAHRLLRIRDGSAVAIAAAISRMRPRRTAISTAAEMPKADEAKAIVPNPTMPIRPMTYQVKKTASRKVAPSRA